MNTLKYKSALCEDLVKFPISFSLLKSSSSWQLEKVSGVFIITPTFERIDIHMRETSRKT
jgi:hypothetical protein